MFTGVVTGWEMYEETDSSNDLKELSMSTEIMIRNQNVYWPDMLTDTRNLFLAVGISLISTKKRGQWGYVMQMQGGDGS